MLTWKHESKIFQVHNQINDLDIRLTLPHPYPPPTPQMYPWCVYSIYRVYNTSEYVVGRSGEGIKHRVGCKKDKKRGKVQGSN